jgi:hypothetical protein
MATRYWVGGDGTWDATTTNWSASSGGAGGASAPTSVDNVIFNSASNATAYTVTVGTNAVAADITIAGPATGNVNIADNGLGTSVLDCYGSWLNASTGVAWATTTGFYLNFVATTTGKTITTNGVALGLTSTLLLTFNGVGGGWTLGSALTIDTSGIPPPTITAGSFSTGNFAVNAGGLDSSGTGVRSVTLGTSTLTLTENGAIGWSFGTTTNLTFSGASSTIICSGISPTFAGGSLTYGTVSFTSTTGATTTITGTNTFTNLSQTALSGGTGIRIISLSADQTVSGTLTLSNGGEANRRMFVRSDTVGTNRTLTAAAIAALVDVDFQNITAAGVSATSPWTGTRLGNCLGNTNITFVAGVNKYFRSVSGASAAWSGTVWSTSSADTATPSVNDFPLAQDTVIIDDAGATVNNGLRTGNTVTIGNNWLMGTLSFSGRTTAFTWAQSAYDPIIYGNVTLSSSMTMTSAITPTWTFSGQGLTQALDSAGITLPLSSFIVDSPGGTVSLSRNTTVVLTGTSVGTLTLTRGTLALNTYTFTTVYFSSTNTNTRTLAFGTGKIVITGNGSTVCNTQIPTGLTITGSKRVELSYSGSTGIRIIQGATNASAIEGTNLLDYYIIAGSDSVTFTGGRSCGTIDFSNAGAGTFTGTLTNNIIEIYGNLVFKAGMTLAAGTATVSMRATSGTTTITSAAKTIDFPLTINGLGGTFACSDALTLGSTRALTHTLGTLQLKSGVTSTVGSFVTSGTTLKYLQSTTPGTQATISQASGTVTATYLSVKDSAATGGATWNGSAATNVDAGNNTGWSLPIPIIVVIGSGITIGGGIGFGIV